jgi:nitroreductase
MRKIDKLNLNSKILLFTIEVVNEMDAIKAILSRRSIRTYKEYPISGEIINTLLKAAVSAPSSGNQQPWHFIVIDDRNILDKIPKFHPHANFIINAQKAILVCGDLNLEIMQGYWMIDCSAATENILIAARALGLGACWLGVYPREKRIENLREMLKIPNNIVPFSLISLGYTDEEQKSVDRLKKQRIHYNNW